MSRLTATAILRQWCAACGCKTCVRPEAPNRTKRTPLQAIGARSPWEALAAAVDQLQYREEWYQASRDELRKLSVCPTQRQAVYGREQGLTLYSTLAVTTSAGA